MACAECRNFHTMKKLQGKHGELKPLRMGYCLAQSIFAEGFTAALQLPPSAKIQKLPNNQHKTVIRYKTDGQNCPYFKKVGK